MLPLVGFIGPFAAAVDALLEKFKHPELGFPYVFVWNLNSSLSYLLSTDISNHQNASSWWPKYLLKSCKSILGPWENSRLPGSSMPRWRAKPPGDSTRRRWNETSDESGTEFPYVSWLRSDITVTERNLKKCVFFFWLASFISWNVRLNKMMKKNVEFAIFKTKCLWLWLRKHAFLFENALAFEWLIVVEYSKSCAQCHQPCESRIATWIVPAANPLWWNHNSHCWAGGT